MSAAAAVEPGTFDADDFEDHVFEGETLFEIALPMTDICLAVLAEDNGPVAKEVFSELLMRIVSSSGNEPTPSLQGRDLVAECHEVAWRGAWLLHSEILTQKSGNVSGNCFLTLQYMEEDAERLRALQRAASRSIGNLPLWVGN
ncbi:hypothetical protein ACQEU3_39325 [Spirillospora sp. CA-253888]